MWHQDINNLLTLFECVYNQLSTHPAYSSNVFNDNFEYVISCCIQDCHVQIGG